MNRIFIMIVLCLALCPVSQAQGLPGGFDREDAPLMPAAGNWWTPTTGPGRWGIQIEVQTGSNFPLGFLGATIFTFESADPSIQTWYTLTGPYVYNSNWRQDGYIGEMELNLNQATNGICLLCEDGSLPGSPKTPDIASARLVFKDSVNAELIVGDVVHQLVKSQWGDGVQGHLDDFWGQVFGATVEASYPNTRVNAISSVEPALQAATVEFEGEAGWEVYQYSTNVLAETLSNGQIVQIPQTFQILAHREMNQYRVAWPSATASARLIFKLFPQSRMLVEGRLLQSIGFGDDPVLANILFISSPSMQSAGNSDRPWF